ncbi:MAG: hypothetical protein JO235_12485 [Chroococcidiopsidaceae cyanobacterium CP_BM_RX_35]|nr:hypothetical protein [Chroococcidiopsidaceae cyanobacterium CP_BM_RX_35]
MSTTEDLIAQFQEFRQELYNDFLKRPNSLMDLLDALSSNSNARSPAELSLNPLLRRDYSTLYKAIGKFLQTSCKQLTNMVQQWKQDNSKIGDV